MQRAVSGSPEDWRRLMAVLSRHYGDNDSIDEVTRLSTTAWFIHKHHEVAGRLAHGEKRVHAMFTGTKRGNTAAPITGTWPLAVPPLLAW